MNDHKESAAFNISKSLKAELEDVVPASKRSEFVEQAIAEALLRDARRRALDALETLPSYDTHGEDSVEVLRRIRQDRNSMIVRRLEDRTP